MRAAGSLLREPERLHGAICWEASKIAAGWEASLAAKAPGRCRVTGCPLHGRHGERVWPGQPSRGVLPSDVAAGGLNPTQGALIYHLLQQPSDSGLDVCFVPLGGVNWDHVMLSKEGNENRPSPFPAGFSSGSTRVVGLTTTSSATSPGEARLPSRGIALQLRGTSQIRAHSHPGGQGIAFKK